MAGIYIHIPFCKSRCIYCAFYSSTRQELRQRYVDAVCKEMEQRTNSDFFVGSGQQRTTTDIFGGSGQQRIDTVYLGGGTPSQLTDCQLEQLFNSLYNIYNVWEKAEVTIECNPDDVTDMFAASLCELPVNRVSMGAQTFDDARLRFLHRRHTAAQVTAAVDRLRRVGISNISIDLMYGFPGETLAEWHRDIDQALALDVEHLSAYCLTIEEGTPLYKMLNGSSPLNLPLESHSLPTNGTQESSMDEETERRMYEELIDRLTEKGYEHYEISNFAHPGFRSRHNSSYWNHTPYLGLGAAAHSFDGRRRRWNIADVEAYIEGIENERPLCEYEELDADTLYNDLVMTALRTCEGLRLDNLDSVHRHFCMQSARKYLDSGLLACDNGYLHLTRKALFVSDMVIADLFMV